MAKRGRPLKLTSELADEFCKHIARGMSIHRTGQLLRLDKNTVSRWLKFGRKRSGLKIYTEFAEKVAAAEAEFIGQNVDAVKRAATPRTVKVRKTTTRPVFDDQGNHVADQTVVEETVKREHDWGAARWLLECKDRESFGPDRHEIAALKKDLAELRKVISETVDKLRPADGDQAGEAINPDGRAGTAEGGSGNQQADTHAPLESGV
jgi:hypothetical protein